MKVLFIVGALLSGKSTFAGMVCEILEKKFSKEQSSKQVVRVEFSDSVRKVLEAVNGTLDRTSFSSLCTVLKSQFGPGIVRQSVCLRLQELAESDGVVIVCGGRFLEDLEVLKDFDSWIVAIDASEKVRFKRSKKSSKDGHKTLKQFHAAEAHETEGHVQQLALRAHSQITNNVSTAILRHQANQLAEDIIAQWFT